MAKSDTLQRDWLSKSLAGLLFGLLLGIAVGGWIAPRGPISQMDLQVQLAMWIVVPVWATVQGAVFLFSSGRRAWLWLALLTLLVIAPLLTRDAIPTFFSKL